MLKFNYYLTSLNSNFLFLYKKFWLLTIFCYVITRDLSILSLICMSSKIWACLVWVALSISPFSDSKANNFDKENNIRYLWNKTNTELYQSLSYFNSHIIFSQSLEKHESLVPIDSKIVIDAALSYFDEEVKLYSLKGTARENVQLILKNYLSNHPILKKNSNWEVIFIIDDKQEFASMIKDLANTLFDWMPKIIRDIAVLIAFGWNEELQKTLNNLDRTLYLLPSKQYKDIVFDYFWWILKRICYRVDWSIMVEDYYGKVYIYYPNKNHVQILNELNNTWQIDNDMKDLKYPFKK